jgi:uncharacterized glyoxalase superfamily protein PhnB
MRRGQSWSLEIQALAESVRIALADFLNQKRLPITQELKDQTWGHRSFCVRDPNGLTLYFFREMEQVADDRGLTP